MKDQNNIVDIEENKTDFRENYITKAETTLLPVKVVPDGATSVNRKIIDSKYYNSFNFSKLAEAFSNGKITLGITSATRGEGKTLVAANMAVSLASGYRQKTLLVDMNFSRPQVHNVFGTTLSPGMAEAISMEKIRVLPSGIDNLYLMTAGDIERLTPGIEHTLVLRQILYTLKNKFDFVIIDMNSILPIKNFPIHFINEIDGLINVIDRKNTKKGDFEKVFNHLKESQFVGYVYNRVDKT